MPDNVSTPALSQAHSDLEDDAPKEEVQTATYSTPVNKLGVYLQDGKKQCNCCQTPTWSFCSYCRMYGCFKCCLQQPDKLCPHDNHRGEHVAHETLDPSLSLEQQEAIRAAGEELPNIKNSLSDDFLTLAAWVMEFEANLLAADQGINEKAHLAEAIGEKGESYLSALENEFYHPKNPEFPDRVEFSVKQHRLGYPLV